jgi:hypothetical protein
LFLVVAELATVAEGPEVVAELDAETPVVDAAAGGLAA